LAAAFGVSMSSAMAAFHFHFFRPLPLPPLELPVLARLLIKTVRM